jgi:hypothetical protein
MVGDTLPPLFHQHYQVHNGTHQGAERNPGDPRPSTKYNTARGLSTFAMISGRTLLIKGFCFDIVQEISLASEDKLFFPTTILDHMKKPYPTGETESEVGKAVYLADRLRLSKSRYYVRANFFKHEEKREGVKPNTRAFFLTSRGYMGIGSSAIQCGDSVMILYGGQVPYILRPRNNEELEFIGECYVHGLMFGEVSQLAGMEGFESKLWNIV